MAVVVVVVVLAVAGVGVVGVSHTTTTKRIVHVSFLTLLLVIVIICFLVGPSCFQSPICDVTSLTYIVADGFSFMYCVIKSYVQRESYHSRK